jgi:hypothetical protein
VVRTIAIITPSTIHIDTEDAAEERIQIEDCTVYIVVKNGVTQLTWIDGEYRFWITSNIDYESLVAVTEGIINK